jgi:myo-inositol 2-dehydrogenase/D-chiro-inositol 1-dehydrogenase
MKVAVIGAGRVGGVHAAFLSGVVETLVIHDADERRAQALARKFGGTVAASAGEALETVDAAVIATPPATHARLVSEAIDLSRPVLCEKPLAETAAEAAALADHVAERGVFVEVGFQRRFDTGYAAARSAIRLGDVGRLHLLRFQSTEPGLPPSPKTNIFRNTAIHDFDLVRWLSGDEVASIYVRGADRSGNVFDPRLDPDTIVATMGLARGSLAVTTVSRLSPAGYDVRAEVLGSRDHLSVGQSARTPVRSAESLDRDSAGAPLWESWQTRFADAFRGQLAAFLAAVDGGPQQGATVADAVRAQLIAEAARQSMEHDAPVYLDPAG